MSVQPAIRILDLGTGGLRAALEARRAGRPVPGASPDPALRARFVKVVEFTFEVKRNLAGTGAAEGEFTCPLCSGTVSAAVIGPARHLRLACSTPDCIRVIE